MVAQISVVNGCRWMQALCVSDQCINSSNSAVLNKQLQRAEHAKMFSIAKSAGFDIVEVHRLIDFVRRHTLPRAG